MCILITRPFADSQHTAKDLAALGIKTKIAPLYEIGFLHPDLPVRPYQAVIFTSRYSAWNFMRHYADHHKMTRNLSAFCVGDGTAAALGDNAPFAHIYSADGDAVALHQLISEKLTDKTAPLLRFHADLEKDPLYDALIQDGYDVTRIAFYRQEATNDLPQDVIQALRRGTLSGIAFYSPNAARNFVTLAAKSDLSDTCETLTAWCISKNTEDALQGMTFKTAIIAKTPTYQAMLDMMSQNEPVQKSRHAIPHTHTPHAAHQPHTSRTRMNDQLHEKNPLTIRHWLLQTIVTSSIVCTVILALAFLFLPDGIIQLNQAPAIKADQELIDTKKMHQRLTQLEQRLTQTVQADKTAFTHDDSADNTQQQTASQAEQDLQRTTQAAQEYEQRMRDLQEQALRENRIARMILGATQLKSAYDADGSLQQGIQLLKTTIEDQNLQETLAQLDQLAQDKLPSKQEILHYIHTLQDGEQRTTATQQHAAQNGTEQKAGWLHNMKTRAQDTLGQFVQIRPTIDVQKQKTLDRIAQAVHVSDYSLAAKLSSHLPATPSVQGLTNQLNARAKAQHLIQTISTGIANTVSNPNTRGALY